MSASPPTTPSTPAAPAPREFFSNPLSANTGATVLAAVGGYVDTLGFIALFGLFTAHVTGNFVLIGAELARPGHGVLLKFLAFPTFILAVAASRVIAMVCERRNASAIRATFLLQGALLLAFMAAGLMGHPMRGSTEPWSLAAGLLGTAAMGLQNGAGRLLLAKLTPHTVMTGNVTQVVLDATDLALGCATPEARPRLAKMIWPIVAFGAGAILGALGFMQVHFFALLPAALAILYLGVRGIKQS